MAVPSYGPFKSEFEKVDKMTLRMLISFVIISTTVLWLSLGVARAQSGEHVAVLIGNKLYPNLNHDVDVTPNNLLAFETYLSDVEHLRSSAVLRMIDLPAIKLRSAFNPQRGEIAKHLKKNPRARKLTVYYSGHGTQDPEQAGEDQGILLGADAEVGNEMLYGVSTAEIIDNLATLAVETDVEITLILEACFSGQTGTGEPLNDETSGSLSDELGRKSAAGVTVVSASSKTQPAYWQSADEYLNPLSRFTDAFLDALYGYNGGLDDGVLTLDEALNMANDIMLESDSDQVATVAGLNAEDSILREGSFIVREATRGLCSREMSSLRFLSRSCSAKDVRSQLNARQCRYPDEITGYDSALRSAEKQLISLRNSEADASQLDQWWLNSNQSARAATSYIEQCEDTAIPGCEQKCVEAKALAKVRDIDESQWAVLDRKKTRAAIKQYLSDCEKRVFCTGRDEARTFLDDYERDEGIAEDLYAEYSKDPDIMRRLEGLETLVASLPDTQTAARAKSDIDDIQDAISDDQKAWRSVNRDSESSLERYLRECQRRLICQNEASARELLQDVRILNEQAATAFSEAKAIPELIRKQSALRQLIANYPNSEVASQVRSYLKDISKNAKICVVRFTDRGSVSRRDYRTSSFSDLHVGKPANSSSSYHVVLNTGSQELTVPLSYNANGRVENKRGEMPGGQMLAAFVQTRVRSLDIAPQFLADMETCAEFFRSKGATPPTIRTDFVQVAKNTPKRTDQDAQTTSLDLDAASETNTAAQRTNDAAEFIVTDNKKGIEVSVGPINIIQNTVGSSTRLTGKLVADVLLLDAYENGVQLFDTPRSVRIVVDEGIVTLIPNNLDYDLPNNLANMRLHMEDRTTIALVFRRLKKEPEVAAEIASLCKVLSSRGLGEQLMSRFGVGAVAGSNIWNVAQRCLWVAPD